MGECVSLATEPPAPWNADTGEYALLLGTRKILSRLTQTGRHLYGRTHSRIGNRY
jgi:hypothetical protein